MGISTKFDVYANQYSILLRASIKMSKFIVWPDKLAEVIVNWRVIHFRAQI